MNLSGLYRSAFRLQRSIHLSCLTCKPMDAQFKKAKEQLNTLKNEPGNDVKLKIYALFKQATEGKCTKPKPGMMDFVGKAKWEAWNSLGGISKEDAMSTYVTLVTELAAKEGPPSSAPSAAPGPQQLEGLSISRSENGVLTILLNRPDKFNAITWKMYDNWSEALNKAGKDDSVKLVVITGAGDYFCSGNDLSNFTEAATGNVQEMARIARGVLLRFVDAFIDFPKPLIGLVNGPAVGISVTTLGLYDAVFASDHATFHTPFSNLGQTPEACSTLIFPRIMGPLQANSMIMFNRKVSAEEAHRLGLVTEVLPRAKFSTETARRVEEMAQLPPQALRHAKALIRNLDELALLHRVNQAECDRLMERWTSDECMQAIVRFFQRKPKL